MSKATEVTSKVTSKTMIIKALETLDERHGTSFQGIKKFIAGHYNVDVESRVFYMKKALMESVRDGIVKKTTGGENSVSGK